jgi:hypothetical protein
MLLWALYPGNPYAYYILLRWVCCAVFAYLAFQSLEQGKIGWVWIMGTTALIYNPILRVHLNRELWSVVNVVTIGIALTSIFTLREKKEKHDEELTRNYKSASNIQNNNCNGSHIIIQCKHCSQKLRLPAKKGLLNVTCPSCKNIFNYQSEDNT